MACAHARLGQKDKAFENLDKAIQAGFNNRQLLTTDDDLASLRDDARYTQLLGRITG